jgi:hypothetical protein
VARLKVFVTSDGLTDYVVAATSRPKALAAWGAHQDLFKTGGARETDDPALVKAATAQPGEVLRRPADSKGALTRIAKLKPAKPKGPSKAALRKVENLERKLDALKASRAAAEARLDAARAELEARAERETEKFDAEAEGLRKALETAREAL